MKIEVIDSHTGGEPTRVVISGWDIPAGMSTAEMRDHMRTQQEHLMNGVLLEPRGSDVIVGAVLVPPTVPESCTGVVYFNNAGVLGMCGHGTIGVVQTLKHMGIILPGPHKIETPVGNIEVQLEDDGTVWITNVPAYTFATNIKVQTKNFGEVIGDIAWGGNWFFLTQGNESSPKVNFENRDDLTRFTVDIRTSLDLAGIRAADGAIVDHVEVFGPPIVEGANSKNFVLCPGMAYDRSACGTGTSAKMATLVAHGKLKPDQMWVQESITGTIFTGFITMKGDQIIPHISGKAYITAESTLIFSENDPFQWGIA